MKQFIIMKSLRSDLKAFIRLGEILSTLPESTLLDWYPVISNNNAWFTPESVKYALDGIVHLLKESDIVEWDHNYRLPVPQPKRIGIIAAGNIPAVAFHDIVCVLLSGHEAYVKLSSTDKILLPFLFHLLENEYPNTIEKLHWVDQLKGMDAYIATGSDNSARYFEYYFKNTPHIIRKNRTSIAILKGTESKDTLQVLGHEVFKYFGLGCRNVSKIFLPKGYSIPHLLDQWKPFEKVAEHHKYFNNYEYNKAVYLINSIPHWDTGAVLLKEDTELFSPIGVVFIQFYEQESEILPFIQHHQSSIQCVVGEGSSIGDIELIPIGYAQCPDITEYADGIDTMEFLINL